MGKIIILVLLGGCVYGQQITGGGTGTGSATAAGATGDVQCKASNGNLAACGINDNGVTVAIPSRTLSVAGTVATGASPPAITPGTGGGLASTEGTAPVSGCPAAGVDCWYASSASHAYLMSFNNDTALPIARTVASGSSAMATSAIASATCATTVTASATGVLTTDVIGAGFNGDPTAATGYVPATTGMLTIISFPTSGNVNFKVCNNTSASITPGAVTLNWRVTR